MKQLGGYRVVCLSNALRIASASLIALSLQACQPWRQATPPAGGFTVSLPWDPPCHFIRGPKEFGSLPGSTCRGHDPFYLSAMSIATYAATGYALAPGQDLALVREQTAAEFRPTSTSSFVVVSQGERLMAGATWTVTVIEDGDLKSRLRAVRLATVRPEGVFTMVVASSVESWSPQKAERFFESFRFRGSPGDFKESSGV